jgi:type III pantothenate kinase
MLLVADVGNTNTVIGVFDNQELTHHWRIQTHREVTADEHGIVFLQLFQSAGIDPLEIKHAIISSVVPPVTPRLETTLSRFFKVSPLVVGRGIKSGMPIRYANPRDVGADRIVNAVAAYEQYQCGLIIVDFGTATTFDAVTPDGEYLGGAIAPGVNISADALFRRTAKLPRVEIAKPPQVIGRTTIDSIQSGIVYGYAGLVSELIQRMKAELEFATKVIATGGLADLIATEVKSIDVIDQHITLTGLRILFERNRP